MIELRTTGKCVGCPGLKIDVLALYADGRPAEPVIKCENSGICKKIEEHLKRGMEGGTRP